MEHKQNPSVTWAVWIPTLWLTLISSRDLAFWLGRGDADPGTGSPYQRAFLLLLCCLSLIVLYGRRFDWYKAIKDNIWMIMLVLYMFASIFWSHNAPYISLKRWVKELIPVVMALVVLSEDNPRNAVASVLRRSIYVLIPFSLLLVICFPDYGVESFGSLEAWIGVTTHKNALGRLCSISVCFLVWAFFNRWLARDGVSLRYQAYTDMFVLGLALYLLKGPGIGKTVSITSAASLVIGLAMFFGLIWMRKLKRYLGVKTLKTVTVAIIVLGTATVFIGGLVVGGDIVSSLGREETLTGRTEIWAKLMPFAMKEPIIGHGIGGFFTDEMQKSLGNLPHAHNGYMDVILDYGFVGLFFVSMFLLSFCGKAHKTLYYDYAWGSLMLCLLYMTVIYNVAEPSVDSLTRQHMAVLILASVSSLANSEYRSDTNDMPPMRAAI